MNIKSSAYTQFRSGKEPAKTRTIVYDVPSHGLPKCAWCIGECLAPVAEFVLEGNLFDFITVVCYCEYCKKGTAVQFERKHSYTGGYKTRDCAKIV